MKQVLLSIFLALILGSNAFSKGPIRTNKWESVDLSFIAKGKIDLPFQVEIPVIEIFLK